MADLIRRRYVPLSVRVQVAERQLLAAGMPALSPTYGVAAKPRALADRLSYNLTCLFGGEKFELHHRPALVNRPLNRRGTDTVPPANDPEHLVYLLKDEEHRIETYVRGVGAQRSDVSQRRYLKRVAKNRAKPTSDSRIKTRRPKRKWPSRPFPKGRKLEWKR